MKKKIANNFFTIIMILFTVSSLQLSAQSAPNEFSIYGGGGYSFSYSQPMMEGVASKGSNGELGIGYIVFLHPQWGIHFGAGLGILYYNTAIEKLNYITRIEDTDNIPYELHTTLSEYYERHRLFSITVPVMLQFQSGQNQSFDRDIHRKHAFYAMTGIKLCLLPKTSYSSKVLSLTNEAYYPQYDRWGSEKTLEPLGTFEGNIAESSYGFRLLPVFTFEMGGKFHVGNNIFLYIGPYFECGLTDPAKSTRKPLKDNIYKEHLDDLTLLGYAERINVMSVGIKLRLSFFSSQHQGVGCSAY